MISRTEFLRVVMVVPHKYSMSNIVGKMKVILSRELRFRDSELKRTYWGGAWSHGFFPLTVKLNEGVIRWYAGQQE